MDALLDFWTFFLFGLAQQKLVRKLRLDLFGCLLRQEVRKNDGVVDDCGAPRCCDEDGGGGGGGGGGGVVVCVVVVAVMIHGVVVWWLWWRGAGCLFRRIEQRRADKPANGGHTGDVRGPYLGVPLHHRGHGALSCLHTVITTIVVLLVVIQTAMNRYKR